MYIEYWRLKTKPFENTCDTAVVSMASQHKEGLARLIYTVRERKGGAILSGQHGTGKSLIRKLLINRLREMGDYIVALVDNPLGEPREILQDIYDQIVGKPTAFTSYGASMRELREAMLVRSRRGYRNIVMVEEAQLLDDRDRIEQIRLLTNLQDDQGGPLATVILFGNFDFATLERCSPSLLQRLPSRWTLTPLDRDQTRHYIDDRLYAAGGNAWIFDDSAVEAIHAGSGGIARRINNVCDLALYVGMTENAVRIDGVIAQRLLKEETDRVHA